MEELNKNQIILLALLVSFVTSIATGIMTTSLLQEAPIEVTRNINRVVEKTIETVTQPATVLNAVAPSTGTKEVTTVIVKEDDAVVESISKNTKSLVRIEQSDSISNTPSLYAIGLVVSKDGLIAAERKAINLSNSYVAVLSDGTEMSITPVGLDKKTDFILFKQIPGKQISYTFSAATFADLEPKLGQTVVGLGGTTENAIAVGRVTSLNIKDTGTATSTAKYLDSIDTDIVSKDMVDGSLLFNLSGDVIGIKMSDDPAKTWRPISFLRKELAPLFDSAKAQ